MIIRNHYNYCVFKRAIIKALFLFIFLASSALKAFAQDVQIRGEIIDTFAREAINEASILLINAKDSFLVADARSDKEGAFTFSSIPKGKYILLVTYPEYVDYVEKFSIDTSSEIIDFNKIGMTLKARLLKDVVIMGRKGSSIRFKGDTTEYIADSFHVQPNASVEDLLKQLPGIQVDKDGKITAHGRAVDKVLVDGEEFFGDDPTLVTRNLKANMVDKVQLYDKTSDQTAFTGINDGQKKNTLDLKLKKDKKNGYFGKVQLGGGNNGFYENQAMFNSFKEDRKFAAYLTFSNTGKVGLDKRSQQSYAGGDANPISNDLDSWNGTYGGVGIPSSISGGLHYDNKWDTGKQDINTNYKLGGLDIMGAQNTITQNNLPGNVLYSTSNQSIKNHMFRQGLNAGYNIKLDSSSTLKIYAEGSLLNKTTNENDSSETKRQNLSDINNSRKNISTNGNIRAFNSNILWQKKFKKERRTFSLNFNSTFNNNKSNGAFYTKSNFFDSIGNFDSNQIVDQHKSTSNHAESYGVNATYTDILGKYGSLVANYGIFADNAKAELLSYDKSGANIYSSLDSFYSNNYQFDQFSNKGGLTYVYNKKKVRFQFGNDIAINEFTQTNLFANSIFKRSFTNWYPKAQFEYNFSTLKSISLDYNGNTIQPIIQQLQPVANNNDPLNVYVGNPNLKPTFSNNISLSYSVFKTINSSYLNIRTNYSNIYNPITTSIQTNGITGKNTYTYVNLKGEQTFNYSGNIFYSTNFKIWDLGLGINSGFNGNRYANITNGLVNVTNANYYQLQLFISKMKQNLYNAYISFGPNYSSNKSSLQYSINNNYWGYQIDPSFEFYLPRRFVIHTNGDYMWQDKTQTFTNSFSRFVWNAWVGKKILKSGGLLFKFSVNDILNQNVGFNRRSENNVISQNTYNTIARYFMISAIWDFNKMGEKKKQ